MLHAVEGSRRRSCEAHMLAPGFGLPNTAGSGVSSVSMFCEGKYMDISSHCENKIAIPKHNPWRSVSKYEKCRPPTLTNNGFTFSFMALSERQL